MFDPQRWPDFAPRATPRAKASARGSASAFHLTRAVTWSLVVALALAVRLFGLSATGFSEDEVNKLRAVEAYRQGDFSANAEHPMLMKLADWCSLDLAGAWNRRPRLAAIGTISPEAALRLPNVLAGAATAGVLFLLAETMFGAAVGAWAGLFWALDVNAASINRIGKEDTFLLFFLLLASYCYERAKAAPPDSPRREGWYRRSAASFGLMFASKYFPQYLGLHTLFNVAADRARGPQGGGGRPRDKRLAFYETEDKRLSFYATMAAAFLAANFTVVLPHTWRYIAAYVRDDARRHTGYAFAHHIYVNTVSATPGGLPPWFYLTFFATKVSLPFLAVAVVGLVWAARHSADRGATFLRVFLVFALLPYSLAAGKFLRYILPVMAVVDVAAGVGIVQVLRWIADRGGRARAAVASGLAMSSVIVPLLGQAAAAAPFYGLAQNALGAALFRPGSLFPDDELYDAGLREAVTAIARAARPGAVVCSDATAAVEEYLARNGRRDVTACSIAQDGLPMRQVETWVIAEDSHMYFENALVIDQLGRRQRPWLEVEVGHAAAVRVFHLAAAGAASP